MLNYLKIIQVLMVSSPGKDKSKTKNKSHKVNRILLVFSFLILIVIYLFVGLDKKQPCHVVYEEGSLISDTCKSIDPNMFCEAGISKYTESVRTGIRVESDGYCVKAKKGPGFIGP